LKVVRQNYIITIKNIKINKFEQGFL
jgi:hypothetical protein